MRDGFRNRICDGARDHRSLFRFNYDDYKEVSKFRNGPSPEGSSTAPNFVEAPESFAPDVSPEDLEAIARKL